MGFGVIYTLLLVTFVAGYPILATTTNAAHVGGVRRLRPEVPPGVVTGAVNVVDNAAEQLLSPKVVGKIMENADDGALAAVKLAGNVDDKAIAAAKLAGKVDDEAIAAAKLAGKVDDEAIAAAKLTGKVDDEAIAAAKLTGNADDKAIAAANLAGKVDDEAIAAAKLTGNADDKAIAAAKLAGKVDDEAIAAVKLAETADEAAIAAVKVAANGEKLNKEEVAKVSQVMAKGMTKDRKSWPRLWKFAKIVLGASVSALAVYGAVKLLSKENTGVAPTTTAGTA